MTVLGVRLHCRRERALGDDARSKNCYRDEVGSGSKRRVMPIRSLSVNPKGVVLVKTDMQIHIDIGIDGFQREDYAGGVLRSLQPEQVILGKERWGSLRYYLLCRSPRKVLMPSYRS